MVVIVKEENGKIVLTKEELEAIIKTAKAEGRREATPVAPIIPTLPYHEPWWASPWVTTDHIEITC